VAYSRGGNKNMKSFFSKKQKEVLLYVINEYESITDKRKDLSPENECLQVSCKKLYKGNSFIPHRHLPLERNTLQTQETWVILEGKILARFYDIDNSFYAEHTLKSGDCVVAYNAGHSFEVIEDNTILYEIKNGPYYGMEKDKEEILN
jgi:mannose-6-phosphate isomerase-like protein (cupin superfamily)